MSDGSTEQNARPFPRFLEPWRERNGDDFTPRNFINADEGIEFVIAAQWLFCPNFLEYRGAIIASDFSSELSPTDRETLDRWFERFGDDVSQVEAMGNLTTLPDVFVDCDTEPYEEDLSHLAYSIAECWRGLLKLKFPDRDFTVEVYDDWDEPFDPKITFYTTRPEETRAPESRAPSPVAIHILPAGQFAVLGDVPTSVHVDLPPSLRDAFAGIGDTGTQVVDVRSVPDDAALHHTITPGAAGLADALTRVPTSTVLFTSVEQLWVKNRPVAERLLTELPAALTAAHAAGHPVHVALADLASGTVTSALALLRDSPSTGADPVPVFHYPPSA